MLIMNKPINSLHQSNINWILHICLIVHMCSKRVSNISYLDLETVSRTNIINGVWNTVCYCASWFISFEIRIHQLLLSGEVTLAQRKFGNNLNKIEESWSTLLVEWFPPLVSTYSSTLRGENQSTLLAEISIVWIEFNIITFITICDLFAIPS